MAAKRILLVEGDDDEHVLKHLCGNRGVPQLDEIKPLKGINRLLDSISTRLRASEDGDIVGVVIDADIDLSSRWHSLRNRLISVGYRGVPEDPLPDGTILDPPDDQLLPRVGIWIMPDNQTTGILEDFLRFLVPIESPLFKHVLSSVAAIPEGERRFTQLAEPKAIIHTWLAWQVEPGKPLGTAITARYLDPDVAQVDILVSWLKRLYFP
ncbi:DUF3226 domain-containing protein [Candidatus Amarolinea aalborgensis]|jgi:hypothetical protein|uniref:DUF3226 domain-containing protein n=1 Tax=Candidatus Amarolinea aalborgensis TaxID=2249329 RepID=UPI003BF9ACBF